MLGKIEGRRRRVWQRTSWYHQLDGHEFEQAPGVGDGQGSLASCSPVQFSSVTQSCPTLCDPMDCSTPGLPVHHQLLESTQIHVHWVGDAIQPSHFLSSSSPALNLSQHQGLFKWVSSLHQVPKVLEFQLQHQSFQWTPRTNQSLLAWTGWISLQSKGLSRVFSNTIVQKHQFFSAQLSSQSNSHIHTWLLKKQ